MRNIRKSRPPTRLRYFILFAVIVYSLWVFSKLNRNIIKTTVSIHDYQQKIIEIGLSKTGTSSLGIAFEKLGYVHCGWNKTLSKEWIETGNEEKIIKESEHCDMMEDGPWHSIDFKIWTKRYPNAKFILLERDDESWVTSMERWFSPKYNAGNSDPMYLEQKWITNLDEMKKETIKNKHRKYKNIIDYFQSSGKEAQLLVMNLGAGDGWEKLCAFLNNKTKPYCASENKIPFPRQNTMKEVLKRDYNSNIKTMILPQYS
eukprot:425578_1